MPVRCPQCRGHFKKAEDLHKHLNHPMTSCRPWLTELVKVSELLGHGDTHNRKVSQSDVQDISMENGWDMDMGQESREGEDMGDLESTESAGPCRDVFPDAAKVFGKGSTFMDRFDDDENASMREDNLFYPFASREDWELASWLSRSSLSMASIDSFLSLELVSYLFLSYLVCLLIYYPD